MLVSLEIQNYRCFESLSLNLEKQSSSILIGKNGTGKSTLRRIFRILQEICDGDANIANLFSEEDLSFGGQKPISIRVTLELSDQKLHYNLQLGSAYKGHEFHVLSEEFKVNDDLHAERDKDGQVTVSPNTNDPTPWLSLRRQGLALPIVTTPPIAAFRNWFKDAVIISPVPTNMSGTSQQGASTLRTDASNFGDWFFGHLQNQPSLYTAFSKSIEQTMPDFHDFQNQDAGPKSKRAMVSFRDKTGFKIAFDELSDGEKCYMLGAVILSLAESGNLPFLFWDEPDNHMSLDEVQHFIRDLRRLEKKNCQVLITSHHPETIRCFSDDSTLVIGRPDRVSPSTIKLLKDVKRSGTDLINSLLLGEMEP